MDEKAPKGSKEYLRDEGWEKPKGATHYLRGVGWKTDTQLAEIAEAQAAVVAALDALAEVASSSFAAQSADAWKKAELSKPPGRKKGADWTAQQIVVAQLPYSAPALARMTGKLFGPQSPEAAARAILRVRAEIKARGAGKLLLDAMTREAAHTPLAGMLSPNDLRTVIRAGLISARDALATKKAE